MLVISRQPLSESLYEALEGLIVPENGDESVNQETQTYEMSLAEIAGRLGISEKAVGHILCHALTKLRARPQIWANFHAVVREKRRALDARPGNGPWHHARRMRLTSQGEQACVRANYFEEMR